MRKAIIVIAALAGLPGLASAQEPPPARKEGSSRLVQVKDWTIKTEVNTLTSSMKQFNGLINSLTRANKDLGKEFKAYLADPDNELKASRVEKKLAAYAANVSKDFDAIIANQDVFSSNFRNLQHKLGMLAKHLESKSVQYRDRLGGYKTKANEIERGLIDLATKIKDPSLEPAEKRRLKLDFAAQLRRLKLQQRYLKGYTSRYQGYLRLKKNMASLGTLFSSLHGKFEELVKNLENEKKYLKASIELQADTLQIKKLIKDGIIGGQGAITTVSEKLAVLYLKVDTFNEVHDRISGQMNKFMDSQGLLSDVTEKINSIGGQGTAFGDLNKDLDKVIEEFSKKSVDDVGDDSGDFIPSEPKKEGNQ